MQHIDSRLTEEADERSFGLSLQQAMGVQVENWGTASMNTSRTVTELVA